jgi:two-component system response regulator VicR
MRKKVILLGEDEKVIAEMYKVAFDKAGFTTVLAFDGEEVIAKVKEAVPDIILLDINMPKKDGYQVLKEITEDLPLYKLLKSTPIIMLTNYNNPQDIDYAMRMGAQDYLVKTEWTPEAVAQKVKKYLGE